MPLTLDPVPAAARAVAEQFLRSAAPSAKRQARASSVDGAIPGPAISQGIAVLTTTSGELAAKLTNRTNADGYWHVIRGPEGVGIVETQVPEATEGGASFVLGAVHRGPQGERLVAAIDRAGALNLADDRSARLIRIADLSLLVLELRPREDGASVYLAVEPGLPGLPRHGPVLARALLDAVAAAAARRAAGWRARLASKDEPST